MFHSELYPIYTIPEFFAHLSHEWNRNSLLSQKLIRNLQKKEFSLDDIPFCVISQVFEHTKEGLSLQSSWQDPNIARILFVYILKNKDQWQHAIPKHLIYKAFASILLQCDEEQILPLEAIFHELSLLSIEISGGDFLMGAQEHDMYASVWEEPVHKETLCDFEISTYPVTQLLYRHIMGVNPSIFVGQMSPVDSVSWVDAITFCNLLSIQKGYEPAYYIPEPLKRSCKAQFRIRDPDVDQLSKEVLLNKDANGYRLPTEAQWEYAARAGTSWLYSGSDDLEEVGWYRANSNLETHTVGQKSPNTWGLYDMSGNIFEWCEDVFQSYQSKQKSQYVIHENRVKRGGSHVGGLQTLRVTARGAARASDRGCMGFRLVRMNTH